MVKIFTGKIEAMTIRKLEKINYHQKWEMQRY
jgi:hypothetical protein